MAHDLFGDRFVEHEYRHPAWHGLGTVTQEPISARKAFELAGVYDVNLLPLIAVDTFGNQYPLNQNAIMRSPTHDDPEYRSFGIVSPEYTLIRPMDFADIWDEHVAQPIETFGVLAQGANIFISTYLPEINVRGDQVENYLLAISPMTGNDAAEIRVTPVRVVCQNTLMLSKSMSAETYRIVHDATARDRMANWLSGIYERAVAKTEVLKEAFDILAGKQVSAAEVEFILEAAYPLKEVRRYDAPEDVMEEREARVESRNRRSLQRREAALTLFEGEGTGIEMTAMKGTAWGIYNAITETEDYRRGRSDVSVSTEAVFGRRAQVKERAFGAALRVSNPDFSLN